MTTEYVSVLRGFQNGNFYSGPLGSLGGTPAGFLAAVLFLIENDAGGSMQAQTLWGNTDGLNGWSIGIEPAIPPGPPDALDVVARVNGLVAARATLTNTYAGVPLHVLLGVTPGQVGVDVALVINGILAAGANVAGPFVASPDAPIVGALGPVGAPSAFASQAQILGVVYHEGGLPPLPAGVTAMSFYKSCREANDMVWGLDTSGRANDWLNRWSVRDQLSGTGIVPVGSDGPLPPVSWLPSAGNTTLTRTGTLLTVRAYKNFDWGAALLPPQIDPGPPPVSPEAPNTFIDPVTGELFVSSAPGAIGTAFAMFYGLTAGTGNGGPTDYAATVATGAAVPFPRLGPTVGGAAAPTLVTPTTFNIPAIGTYEVVFEVHTTEPGQLQLRLNGAALPETTAANANPTAGGHPIAHKVYITTTLVNSVLEVINPAGNATALTVTPADGSLTHANSQILLIKRVG